jgi:hypothetical protein
LEKAKTDVPKSRIWLMTSWQQVCPQDDFDKQFGKDPDTWGYQADVIDCTSIIGVGFSIEAHFTHFYAYFHKNILTLQEERQFLQRLQFWLSKVPKDVDKQSYTWIERLYHTDLCCDPVKVWHVYDLVVEVLVPLVGGVRQQRAHCKGGPLESTELCGHCERLQSSMYHFELWAHWLELGLGFGDRQVEIRRGARV